MLKGSFVKSISLLVGGTVLAQVITFLATLYLTKIYSPDSFGLLSFATSYISALLPVATLRYDKAIIVSNNDREAYALVLLSFLSSLSLVFVLFILSLVFYLFDFFADEYNVFLVIVPLGVLLFSIVTIFQMFFEYYKKFKITSRGVVVDAFSKTTSQFVFSTFAPLYGMVLGYIFSLVVGVIHYFSSIPNFISECTKCLRKDYLILVAKKHYKFPKYLTFTNVLKSISTNICSFTFPIFFTLGILGNLSIAFKIIKLPASVVSSAVRRVYYPKASGFYKKDIKQLLKLYSKLSKILISVSTIPVLIVWFYTEDIFHILFKESWWSAAKYAQVILVYIFVNFINSLSHENMIILGLQKKFLIIESIQLCLGFVLIYISHLMNDHFLAIKLYVLVGVLMEITLFITQYKQIINKINTQQL